MKKLQHIVLILFLLMVTGCHSQATKNNRITNTDITTSMMLFHHQLIMDIATHDDSENPVISSLSAYLSLLTCMQGANGETKSEIMDVLKLEYDQADTIIQTIHSTLKEVPLQIKDGFFSADDQTLQPSFQKFLNTISADYVTVNFQSSEAAEQITAWISQQTKQNLAPKLSIPEATKAVLVNTLFTQNQWADDVNMTAADGYFMTTEDDQMININTFQTNYRTLAIQNEDYHVARLPMKEDMYVYFILPNEQTPREVLTKYPSLFQDIQKAGTEKEVYFSIPNFCIEKTINLTSSLKRLGMKQAFQENADFTNMTIDQPFMLSTIQQSTMFHMNETGVKAASATIIGFTGIAQQREDIMDLYLDHPFLYYVTYEKDDLIIPLFTGIYDTPTQTLQE